MFLSGSVSTISHYHCMNIIVGCFLFESDGTLFGSRGDFLWQATVANHWNRKRKITGCLLQCQKEESTMFVFEASEPDPEFVVIPELMLMMMLLMMMMMMINFRGSLYIWVEITTFACIDSPLNQSIETFWVAWTLGDACSKVFDEAWISKYIKLPWGSFFVRYLTFRPSLRIVEGQGISLASPWVRMSHHRAINSLDTWFFSPTRPEEFGQYLLCRLANGCRLHRPDRPTIVQLGHPMVFACFASWMGCLWRKKWRAFSLK